MKTKNQKSRQNTIDSARCSKTTQVRGEFEKITASGSRKYLLGLLRVSEKAFQTWNQLPHQISYQEKEKNF